MSPEQLILKQANEMSMRLYQTFRIVQAAAPTPEQAEAFIKALVHAAIAGIATAYDEAGYDSVELFTNILKDEEEFQHEKPLLDKQWEEELKKKGAAKWN